MAVAILRSVLIAVINSPFPLLIPPAIGTGGGWCTPIGLSHRPSQCHSTHHSWERSNGVQSLHDPTYQWEP